MLNISENSSILKNEGYFWIPHPQISLKQYSNICENIIYFLWQCGGGESYEGFSQIYLM